MKRFSVVLVILLAFTVGQATAQAVGTVAGSVTDPSGRPLAGAGVNVAGTTRSTQTGADGRYTITGVPAGSRTIRASFAGFTEGSRSVTVAAGQTAIANIQLTNQVVQLEGVVAVGYGTQRREAVTGSVSTVNIEESTIGLATAPTAMLEGRVAGVSLTRSDGTPGAGVQVRVRGGTSLSASNEPLYVVDNVPINNQQLEPGGGGATARNPLNTIDPNDIESITVLKDASATAVYGSRGANGVVLITTKRGREGRVDLNYDGSVSYSRAAKIFDVLTGEEYRSFIQDQVSKGNLLPTALAGLGNANTNWAEEVMRNTTSQNHTVSFSGGSASTQVRGSLGYANEEGVVVSSGLKRYSGRVNANQQLFTGRVRLGLNLNATQINNDYVAGEGGGGIFGNTLAMDPTQPIYYTDPATGTKRFFQPGEGTATTANPLAQAMEILDDGLTSRLLGNITADVDLLPQLTAQFNFGVDRSNGQRRAYTPISNPAGMNIGGSASFQERNNRTNTFQSYLTYESGFGASQFDVMGGYEFNDYSTTQASASAQGFVTDAFSYNNLGAGATLQRPSSSRVDSRLVSIFGRANYSLMDRYFLTGVLRRDGSSRFGSGNKWAVFPALSAAWLVSDESFMQSLPFSELRVKAGYGLQGSQEIDPYSSIVVLAPSTALTVFGEQAVIPVAPNQNANPNLRWEQTAQWNVGLDWGVLDGRLRGTVDYYQKETTDLLLRVDVPQPALVTQSYKNVGSLQNRGLELTLDAELFSTSFMTASLGLVGSMNRNKVLDLGGTTFLNSGTVTGQGQVGQNAQRLMPGHPVGTFYGPVFAGWDANGKQLFNDYKVQLDEKGNVIRREVVGTTATPAAEDYTVLGQAFPDFEASAHGQLSAGRFDLSFLVRGQFGNQMFNNTALVYSTKGNALQSKNFLRSALTDPTGIKEPSIFSSRWIEDASFIRGQNITVAYNVPGGALPQLANARIYGAVDNVFLFTDYTGVDPEVTIARAGGSNLEQPGIDNPHYPTPRTFTAGVQIGF